MHTKEVVKISEKTIAIRVDEEFHKKIKRKLVENGLTLKEYIIGLIENDLDFDDDNSSVEDDLGFDEKFRRYLGQSTDEEIKKFREAFNEVTKFMIEHKNAKK